MAGSESLKNPEALEEAVPAPKKGKRSWAPAQKLSLVNKQPGFRHRWCDNDPQNIEKKQAEGWVFVDPNQGVKADHEFPEHVSDGKPLTSTKTYRELVAMALPEDLAEARDEYHEELTRKQTAGLKHRLETDLGDEARKDGASGAAAHGTIVIK